MKKVQWIMLVAGCGAVVLAVLLAGCIRPGHHGLPRPPGLPGHHGSYRVSPAKDAMVTTIKSPDGNSSLQLVQN